MEEDWGEIFIFIFLYLKATERLRTFRSSYESKQQYLAMYSSIYGGITTDPAAMVIPMDDHIVHRGHGVFDTAAVMDGLVYNEYSIRIYDYLIGVC